MMALREDDFDVSDPVEAHWSARTILAIFFAASLISALFFGLGYSFGGAATSKRSAAIASPDANGGTIGPSDQTSRDLTGTTALQAASRQDAAISLPASILNAAGSLSVQSSESTPSTLSPQEHPAAVAPMAQRAIISRNHSTPAANGAAGSHIMVQVGAIRNRRDAERLVVELRKKGFHAGIYSGRRDKFLHVQIGPFKDTQRAQTKRHQVLASGFHAILKSAS